VIRRYAMKTKRQRKIIELITNYDIETQEELAAKLVENGFNVTQATISRDIRELNLTKIATKGGKQKYAVQSSSDIVSNSKYMRVLNDGIITMDTAGNILVVKTVSGMAMAVAAALDAMQIKEILGCIAGDDTIMCAVRTADLVPAVIEKISNK